MNKETLMKAIPYVILVIGVALTLFSFTHTQSFENKCNEHWVKQIEEYKEYILEACFAVNLKEPIFIVFNSEKNTTP